MTEIWTSEERQQILEDESAEILKIATLLDRKAWNGKVSRVFEDADGDRREYGLQLLHLPGGIIGGYVALRLKAIYSTCGRMRPHREIFFMNGFVDHTGANFESVYLMHYKDREPGMADLLPANVALIAMGEHMMKLAGSLEGVAA